MIMGSLTELAESIQASAIPKWLHDYVQDHRNEIVFDLKTTGVCRIDSPDGKIQIVIQEKKQ